MDWIKCSERMPDDESYVVIINRHRELVAGCVNGYWLDTDDGAGMNMNQAVYWIPLPPNPTE
ncbi:DUF551 domain-containing protein [Rosenbergiella sp. S61]|uniref:DUF551 domain-containing protein n=1 Tax=Rosenbergiella gaditana TaxID=2726987 RepID=A0ABS5T118_9GAMM|nr:DUF551 domain-containing protein [Rosenbergiella gaditana]MBT0725448.1 DUF551 domain-containing protein [Rosenbergiella gaditana]